MGKKRLINRHGKTGWVRSDQVGLAGQSGCRSKQVIFKQVNRVVGQSGRGSSQVEFTRVFQTSFFFFFEIDAICQLFMSSLTVIRFSLVILLPLTNYH